MNFRTTLIVGSVVVCFATFAGVLFRSRQLGDLRAERQLLHSQQSPLFENLARPRALQDAPATKKQNATASPSLELLHLRSEVSRLTNRRRELAGARAENERLRIQLAASQTNGPANNPLPPDYLRKSEARFVGYNAPADTIQSLLWAIQNRDFTNMMEAFTPETVREMRQDVERSGAEEFFNNASIIPGMHIKSQQQMPDGSLELEVEIVPGEPLPDRMRMRQVNGQWKLDSH